MPISVVDPEDITEVEAPAPEAASGPAPSVDIGPYSQTRGYVPLSVTTGKSSQANQAVSLDDISDVKPPSSVVSFEDISDVQQPVEYQTIAGSEPVRQQTVHDTWMPKTGSTDLVIQPHPNMEFPKQMLPDQSNSNVFYGPGASPNPVDESAQAKSTEALTQAGHGLIQAIKQVGPLGTDEKTKQGLTDFSKGSAKFVDSVLFNGPSRMFAGAQKAGAAIGDQLAQAYETFQAVPGTLAAISDKRVLPEGYVKLPEVPIVIDRSSENYEKTLEGATEVLKGAMDAGTLPAIIGAIMAPGPVLYGLFKVISTGAFAKGAIKLDEIATGQPFTPAEKEFMTTVAEASVLVPDGESAIKKAATDAVKGIKTRGREMRMAQAAQDVSEDVANNQGWVNAKTVDGQRINQYNPKQIGGDVGEPPQDLAGGGVPTPKTPPPAPPVPEKPFDPNAPVGKPDSSFVKVAQGMNRESLQKAIDATSSKVDEALARQQRLEEIAPGSTHFTKLEQLPPGDRAALQRLPMWIGELDALESEMRTRNAKFGEEPPVAAGQVAPSTPKPPAPTSPSATAVPPPVIAVQSPADMLKARDDAFEALDEPQDRGLWTALNSSPTARNVWPKERTVGVSDKDLAAQIRQAFGAGGTHSGVEGEHQEVSFRGGEAPEFYYEAPVLGQKRAPTLQGKELVDAARRVLGLPYPKDEDKQASAPSTVAETPANAPVYYRSGSSAPADFDGMAKAGVPVGIVANRISKPVLTKTVDYANNGGKVFIDSGAYTAFMDGLKSGKTPEPVDFPAVLKKYADVIEGVDQDKRANVIVVAPDVIGNHDETVKVQQEHLETIKGLLDAGANVMFNAQKTPDVDLAQQIKDVLTLAGRKKGVVIGIPFNKAAFTEEDVVAALKALGPAAAPDAIHFLGIGPDSKRADFNALVNAVREVAPKIRISHDSNRIAAMFVSGRPAQKEVVTRRDERAIDNAGETPNTDETELVSTFMRGDTDQAKLKVFNPAELAFIVEGLGISRAQLDEGMADARRLGQSPVLQNHIDAAGGDDVLTGLIHTIATVRQKKVEGKKARTEVISEREGKKTEPAVVVKKTQAPSKPVRGDASKRLPEHHPVIFAIREASSDNAKLIEDELQSELAHGRSLREAIDEAMPEGSKAHAAARQAVLAAVGNTEAHAPEPEAPKAAVEVSAGKTVVSTNGSNVVVDVAKDAPKAVHDLLRQNGFKKVGTADGSIVYLNRKLKSLLPAKTKGSKAEKLEIAVNRMQALVDGATKKGREDEAEAGIGRGDVHGELPPSGEQGSAHEGGGDEGAGDDEEEPAKPTFQYVADRLVKEAVADGFPDNPDILHHVIKDRWDQEEFAREQAKENPFSPRNVLRAFAEGGGFSIEGNIGHLQRALESAAVVPGIGYNLKGVIPLFGAVGDIKNVFRKDGESIDQLRHHLDKFPYAGNIASDVNTMIDALENAIGALANEKKGNGAHPVWVFYDSFDPKWWERFVAAPAEESDAVEPDEVDEDAEDFNFSDEADEPAKVDVNEFGEAQSRLPGAENVREANVKTPEFEVPYSLSGGVVKQAAPKESELFGDDNFDADLEDLARDKPKFSRRADFDEPMFSMRPAAMPNEDAEIFKKAHLIVTAGADVSQLRASKQALFAKYSQEELATIRGRTYDYHKIISEGEAGYDNALHSWVVPVVRLHAIADAVGRAGGGSTVRAASRKGTVGITELRRTADARADDSGTPDDLRPYIGARTAQILRDGGQKAGMPEKVIAEQVEDVARINRAFQTDKPMFLLASDPGTGKTFVAAGTIRELRKIGVKKFVYVTLNTSLIRQLKEDFAPFGTDGIEFITYQGMLKRNPESSEILILDESHLAKHLVGPDYSKQAKKAAEWVEQAKFTLFASATPFENPAKAAYLEPTGIFKEPFGKFEQFAEAFGATVLRNGPAAAVGWMRTNTSDVDAKAARDWFYKSGVYTSRRIQLPPDQVDARLVKVTADPAWANRYNRFSQAAADEAQNLGGNSRMWVTNFQKRLLEASKLPHGIEEARKAIERGRFPVIFVETKALRRLNIPELIEKELEWRRDAAMAQSMGDSKPLRKPYGLPPLGIVEVLQRYMSLSGETILEIPAAEKAVEDGLGKDKVAVYTGTIKSDVQRQKNLAEWRQGVKPALVPTIAIGGTGLSLHDKVGDHPTTQINISLPWTATQVVQVTQRTARYGLKGKAEMQWLFAENIPFDRILSRKVGARMADMGAVVHGERIARSQEIEDFDFADKPLSERIPTISVEALKELAEKKGTTLEVQVDRARKYGYKITGLTEEPKFSQRTTVPTDDDAMVETARQGLPMFNSRRQSLSEMIRAKNEAYGDVESLPGRDAGVVLLDNGKKLTAAEKRLMMESPAVRRLNDAIIDTIREMGRKVYGPEFDAIMPRIGILLANNVFGVHWPDPTARIEGRQRSSTVMINGLEFLKDSGDPTVLAHAVFSTILHELAHWEVPTEGDELEQKIQELYDRIDVDNRNRFVTALRSAYADPEVRQAVDPGLLSAFATYAESRRRPSVGEPALGREARYAQRSANEFDAEVSVAEAARRSGREPDTGSRSGVEARPSELRLRIGEVDSLLDASKFIFAPDTRSSDARIAAAELRAYLAARDQHMFRMGKTFRKAERMMSAWSKDESKAFWRAVETSSEANTAALDEMSQKLAETFSNILKDYRDKVIERGLLKSYLDNYWPHEWVNPKSSLIAQIRGVFGKRPFQGAESYQRERVFPTTEDGLKYGLEPVSWNPTTQFLRKIMEMEKSITSHDFKRSLGQLGQMKFININTPRKNRPVDAEGMPWEQLPENFARPEQGMKTPEGRLIKGYYYAPSHVVRLIKNHLSPGLKGKIWAFDMWNDVSNVVTMASLSFSAFHLATTGMVHIVDQMAMSIENAQRGRFKAAMLSLLNFGPQAVPFGLWRGRQIVKEYENDPDASALMEDLTNRVNMIIQAGGGFGWSHLEHTDATKALGDAMAELASAMVHKQPGKARRAFTQMLANAPTGVIQAPVHVIMEHWVRYLKATAFVDRAQIALSDLPANASLNDKKRVLADAWDAVDDVYGLMRYQNLFWNNTFKDAMVSVVRALGWTGGSIRAMFGAPGAQVRRTKENWRAKRAIKAAAAGGGAAGGGKPPTDYPFTHGGFDAEGNPIYTPRVQTMIHPKMVWLISMLITTAIGSAIYQKLMSGKNPESLKDLGFPRTGEKNSFGQELRRTIVGYFPDLVAWIANPTGTAAGKLKSLLTGLYDVYGKNADYFNNQIYDPDSGMFSWESLKDQAAFLASEAKPFTMKYAEQTTDNSYSDWEMLKGYLDEFRTGQPNPASTAAGKLAAATFAQAVAITKPAPAWIDRTAAENQLRKWGMERETVVTKQEQEIRKLERIVSKGMKPGAAMEDVRRADEILTSGELSERQQKFAMKMGIMGETYLQRGVNTLSADRAILLYQKMTPEERATVQNQIVAKVGRKLGQLAPGAAKDGLSRRFDEIMRLPVAQTR